MSADEYPAAESHRAEHAKGAKGRVMPKGLPQQIHTFLLNVDVYLGFARQHFNVWRAQNVYAQGGPDWGRTESRARQLWMNTQTAVLSNGWQLARALLAGGYSAELLLRLLNEIEQDGRNGPPNGENPSWPDLKPQLQQIALRAEAAGTGPDQARTGQAKEKKAKRRPGRPKDPALDPAEDKRLCRDWKAAKANGMTRAAFARTRNIKVSDLIAAQDREKYRRRRDAE
jgi:hypothetical protein